MCNSINKDKEVKRQHSVSYVRHVVVELIRDDSKSVECQPSWYLPGLIVRVSTVPHKLMQPTVV